VVRNDLLTVLVPKNGAFNTNLGKKLQEISKMIELLQNENPIWAAQNKQR
jgi:hypothetical protein